MKNNSNLAYALLLVLGDFLAILAAFSVAYILRVKLDDRPLVEQIGSYEYIKAFAVVLPVWIFINASLGLYSRAVYDNRFREFGRLIMASFLGILVVIGYDFVSNGTLFPARLVPVYGLFLSFGFLIVLRTAARIFRRILFSYGVGINNVLIVGTPKSSTSVVEELINTKWSGYRIVGTVGFNIDYSNIPSFEDFEAATKRLRRKTIHSIIQTKLYSDEDENTDVLGYAQRHHIAYRFIPGNDGVFAGNIEVELFRGVPVVTVHQTALVGWGHIVKRLLDFFLSGLLIILLSPFMLLTAIIVKFANPREPLIFKQTRLTQFDRKFTVYKFRSQRKRFDGTTPEEAFKMLGQEDLAKKYRKDGDQVEKDPRLIRLGSFIRITSLDELPQLFNVFRGDISLVGPRALIPQELEEYHGKHQILSVKSGLTGLAQVSGRRNLSFEERRKLDIYYVQNWSFWLDISILLRTFRAVINGIGAK